MMVGLLSPLVIAALCVRVCYGQFGVLVPPSLNRVGTTRGPPRVIACNSTEFSCSGRCGDGGRLPCSCDDICQRYQDCCQDFQAECKPSSRHLPLSSLIKSDCFETDTGLERLINRCPPGYSNATIRDKCHTTDFVNSTVDHIPVTDMSTDLNYRNIYCAVCNGATSLKGWDARVFCSVVHTIFETLLERIQTGRCETRVQRPAGINGRPCLKEAIRSCSNTSSDELIQECSSYTSYIRAMSQPQKIYRNTHCYQCNNDLTLPEVCIEATEGSFNRKTVFFHNKYDQSILTWNADMKAWGLGFARVNDRPLKSTMGVCEIGDVITSTCPAETDWENKLSVMIPFTIVLTLIGQSDKNTDYLNHDLLNVNNFLAGALNPDENGIVIRGWFKYIPQTWPGEKNSGLALAVFVYFEQRPQEIKMRDILIDLKREFRYTYPQEVGILYLQYSDGIGLQTENLGQFMIDNQTVNYSENGESTTRSCCGFQTLSLFGVFTSIAASHLLERRVSLNMVTGND